MTKYDGKIKEPKCSFCGKTADQVRRLVAAGSQGGANVDEL